MESIQPAQAQAYAKDLDFNFKDSVRKWNCQEKGNLKGKETKERKHRSRIRHCACQLQ